MSIKADYLATPGHKTVQQNAAVDPLRNTYETVRKQMQELQQSWAGAFLAQLFIQFPHLESFRLKVNRCDEYNDEGGTDLITYPEVEDLVFRFDFSTDKDVCREALRKLRQAIDAQIGALADAIPLSGDETGSFVCSRVDIAKALDAGIPVSGSQAYALFFKG